MLEFMVPVINSLNFLGKENIPTYPFFDGLPAPLQEGTYTSSHPYIRCNEEGQKETLDFLRTNRSRVDPQKRVHVGFSLWFNYDMMCITEPACAIICDIDNHMIALYGAMEQLLKQSKTRTDFIDAFGSFLLENGEKLGIKSANELCQLFNLEAELIRPESWLFREETFQIIKGMHLRKGVLYLNLDVTDKTGVFHQIRSWMHHHHLELDTLYVSNINEWLDSSIKKEAYLYNLRQIATVNTRFVHAYKLTDQGTPVQFVKLGVDSIDVPKPCRPKKQRIARTDPTTTCPRRSLNFEL